MTEMSHPELVEGLTQASDSESSEALAKEDDQINERSVYEIGFHVVSTLEEQSLPALVAHLHEALQRGGAKVLAEEFPKRMQFAYRIERSVAGKREKYTEGYFGSIKFEATPVFVQEMETLLRGESRILRHILIHTLREAPVPLRPAVFTSDRLEGETIEKKVAPEERGGEVSIEEIDKSLEALIS